MEAAGRTERIWLLRSGPGGDRLAAWLTAMGVFGRRERPHPGAQLTLFEAGDGWRYSLWFQNALLTATRYGVSASFLTQALELHDARSRLGSPRESPESPRPGAGQRLLELPGRNPRISEDADSRSQPLPGARTRFGQAPAAMGGPVR